MVEQISPDIILVTGVTFDEYLARYMGERAEWVRGVVVAMSPVKLRHDELMRYLTRLLEAYCEQNPVGSVHNAPFVMKLPAISAARDPDIQLVLKSSQAAVKDSYVDGAADLCIEIVSKESIERDYQTKFGEYEKGGVREYWIIDPIENVCHFYRRDEAGKYHAQSLDDAGSYSTPLLPKFVLDVPSLWIDPLPGPLAVSLAVQAMLNAQG